MSEWGRSLTKLQSAKANKSRLQSFNRLFYGRCSSSFDTLYNVFIDCISWTCVILLFFVANVFIWESSKIINYVIERNFLLFYFLFHFEAVGSPIRIRFIYNISAVKYYISVQALNANSKLFCCVILKANLLQIGEPYWVLCDIRQRNLRMTANLDFIQLLSLKTLYYVEERYSKRP